MASVTNIQVRVSAPRATWAKNVRNNVQVIGTAFNVPKCVDAPTVAIAIMCPANVHARPAGLVRCAWKSVRPERMVKLASRSANAKTMVSAMRRPVVVIVRRAGRVMFVRIGVQLVTTETNVKKHVSALTVLIVIT